MSGVIRSPKVYDVCIIGSGAAGGVAAKVLTEGGLKAAMLRFHGRAGDNEIRMAKGMQETFRAIVEAGGGVYSTEISSDGPALTVSNAGGTAIHESGTARQRSVLNQNCQAHDVKNLFVTDAAAFMTSPDKNPTRSILALSWQASEYLLAQSRMGNL